MDAYLPMLANLADGESIVEVLGILGVDGAGEDITEVLTTGNLFGRDLGVDLLGGVFHLLGIFIGQTILGQDGVHLDVVLALLAKDVDNLANDLLRFCRGPLDDFYHGLLACLAALEFLLGYQDVAGEEVALGIEEGKVFLYLQNAHGLIVLALEDFSDNGFLDVVLTTGHEGYLHTVAIEGEHGVALGHKDGLAAIVGLERVLAVGLADKGAFLYLGLQVELIGVVADS